MNTNYFDRLNTLPYDPSNTPLSFKEKMMFDSLYPPKQIKYTESDDNRIDIPVKNVKAIKAIIEEVPLESRRIWRSFREIIIATILFVILQFPSVDTLITRFVKSESFYYKLAAKTAVFAVTFFVLTNFSLARV